MSKIGIVTDSTCDLGPAWLKDHDVIMVPLKVNFGETTYLDWLDLDPLREAGQRSAAAEDIPAIACRLQRCVSGARG